MNPDRQRAYWRRNLLYVAALLTVWALVSYGAGILFADALDRFHLGGFPLGFWFGHQGAMLVFVLLVFAYVRLMNGLDRAFGVYEE
jgi:putative solute:sodium symporter small subunit